MARGMKFISIPYHKSLTETKQFTYTLHPIPKIVCNQFSKANTQCDTIMEAAAGIDTTRVNAINFLFSESDNRKKEVNNKRHIHHARQRHIDTFPPIPTPNTHTAEQATAKKGVRVRQTSDDSVTMMHFQTSCIDVRFLVCLLSVEKFSINFLISLV